MTCYTYYFIIHFTDKLLKQSHCL